MPRILSFERELYAALDLMPFTIRRKLDLAGLKLSLVGWQSLPLSDRRALADAEVDDDASVRSFAAALQAAAGHAGAKLQPLPPPGLAPWRSPAVPAAVRDGLLALGATLADADWAALDDEARYALLKLAGKHPERLRAALVELGSEPV